MKRAAVGFRVHSGWAALVALAVEKGGPVVLVRERVQMVETFTYEFRQPYHTALKLGIEEGRGFVARSRGEARRLALRAIRDVGARLEARGYELGRCGLVLASGRALPGLEQILASHALIHTADGELFREALLHASARCGLEAVKVKEKELVDSASEEFHLTASALQNRLKELGRAMGPPWSQDEKFAALVAWLTLASRARARV